MANSAAGKMTEAHEAQIDAACDKAGLSAEQKSAVKEKLKSLDPSSINWLQLVQLVEQLISIFFPPPKAEAVSK